MIPGLNGMVGFSGVAGTLPTSFTKGGQAESTTISLTAPASIIAGDLLLYQNWAFGFGSPTTRIPTGFTSIANVYNAVNMRSIFSYKVAESSDASSTVSGMNGSNVYSLLIVVKPDNPIVNASANGAVTRGPIDTDPNGKNVLASAGSAPLLVVCMYNAGTAASDITPRTFSTTKDDEAWTTGNTYKDAYIAWKFYSASPSNTQIDMADHGDDNNFMGAWLEFTL